MRSAWMKTYCEIANEGDEESAGEEEGDGDDCVGKDEGEGSVCRSVRLISSEGMIGRTKTVITLAAEDCPFLQDYTRSIEKAVRGEGTYMLVYQRHSDWMSAGTIIRCG